MKNGTEKTVTKEHTNGSSDYVGMTKTELYTTLDKQRARLKRYSENFLQHYDSGDVLSVEDISTAAEKVLRTEEVLSNLLYK